MTRTNGVTYDKWFSIFCEQVNDVRDKPWQCCWSLLQHTTVATQSPCSLDGAASLAHDSPNLSLRYNHAAPPPLALSAARSVTRATMQSMAASKAAQYCWSCTSSVDICLQNAEQAGVPAAYIIEQPHAHAEMKPQKQQHGGYP